MIYLVVDSYCHGCKYFDVEDVVNDVADHILMCSLRKECWEKRKELNRGDENVNELDESGFCDICGVDLEGVLND